MKTSSAGISARAPRSRPAAWNAVRRCAQAAVAALRMASRLANRFLPAVTCLVVLAAVLIPPPVARAQDLGFSADIGAVSAVGDGSFNAATGTYQIDGAGVGLAGSADAFHFAYYESVCGDGQTVVRLVSADANAQAALIVRESLDANAAGAAMSVQNGNAQFLRLI